MRFLLPALTALLVLVAACDATDTADTEATDTTPPPPTETEAETTTSVAITSTTTSTTLGTTTTTTSADGTTTVPGGTSAGLTAGCESPDGFSVSYPEGWSTNSGEVATECSRFHPEPFDLPEGTDERVAAISAFVDPVPFTEVAAPDETRDAERAVTTVDGRQAVRLAYEAQGDGLWPEGTPITLYAVDVGTDEGERTLMLDTVGMSQFDYERNREVLDRMVRTLDLEMEGVQGDPAIVARYAGGGGGFTVEGAVSGDQACLRIPPEGEEVCTDVPAPDQLHTIQLENLQPVLAGVTGEEVHAVTAERTDGTSSTALPAQIADTGTRGFSFTFGLGDVERFVLTDIEGEQLRTIEPGP